MESEIILRDILVKRPFVRTTSAGAYQHGTITGNVTERPVARDTLVYQIVTQEDFMRELDPLGHPINDRELYPDIWRKNEEDGRWYVQEIPRYAIAFQQIILLKHLTHLCGNDVRFELSDKTVSDEKNAIYTDFMRGWAIKNMEVSWFNLCRSVKATGDGAIVGYMDNGKYGCKNLSFLNGDVLYPHYDKYTGKLSCFARKFSEYADDGNMIANYVEVWDNKMYYRFCDKVKGDTVKEKAKIVIKKLFRVNGYELEEQRPHNFPFIPVSYRRNEYGPCWTFSEESIESYEIALSNLAQSNHDFGLPIMYIKGEGSEEVATQDMSYASKIMLLPSDGEIGFLNRQDASNAYKAEIDKLEELIYKQSFAVKTPELKSGDTPGVALKIMYSDAYEKAMNDAHEFDDALDALVEIFSFGYGMEIGRQLDFKNTNIRHYIEPYIHLNVTEITTNLNTSVTGGFLSRQTAAEKSPYATPNEWERICREKKEQQMQELLLQEQRLEIQTEATVAQQEQISDIQKQQQIDVAQAQNDIESGEYDEQQTTRSKSKYKVATGRGTKRGRPNLSGKVWDKNGNNPIDDANNWESWNATH